MNEEFSDYEVLVATSVDGGEITQDISWEVNASKDIVVWCDIAGLMEEGSFVYNDNSITIKAKNKPFTAYIMRKECAEYVISKNTNSTFSVDAILEQLKKNVRILEQLEETYTRTLQCVDEVNPITDKYNRIGKVLSFDKDGNPVCEVVVEDVASIKAYKESASTSASSASQSAINAEDWAEKASKSATSASGSASSASASANSASTMLSDTQTLVGGFDTTVSSKQTEVLGAIDSKQTTVFNAIDSHFSEKLYEKEIEFDEYTDGTISEIDGIKNQAQALVDKAKEIVDPEGFRQDTSANITALQLFKANTGALHFNGGTLKVNAINSMPATFSWCRTIKISQEQWSNITNGTYFDGNAGSGVGLTFFKASNGNVGLKYAGNEFTTGNIFFSTEQRNLLLDGNVHTLVVIGANETLKLYIDNKLIIDRLVSGATSIPQTKLSYQIDSFTGQYSRICNFNFDITSADAPYTIADYQQGKPIPPSALEYTILALEDYTVTNGNEKYVLDYSGNNNDAEISSTGIVKGDNDNRVQTLIDFITDLS